eukprot:482751_1
MTFTLIQYFVPKHIANGDVDKDLDGYWSPSDGDFDWCEHNYVFTPYIAEPLNSGTSLIYIVVAILSLHYTSVHVPPSVHILDIRLVTSILILIGAGSTLFHATLLYKAQLFDEMPMMWIISYTCVILYTRDDYKHKRKDTMSTNTKTWENSRKFNLYALVTVFIAFTCVLVWSTPKHSLVHKICKLIWGLQFVIGFVYCFYVTALCANQVYEKDPNDAR